MILNKKKQVAIFGGSFNPIHNGHLSLCEQVQKQYHFDKILLIPTNIPPHKSSESLASNQDRINMLQIATSSIDYIEVSDIEYKLQGKSYTYNTVMALKEIYNDCEFSLIIGSDMLRIFKQWYCYEKLLDEVNLIVGAREQNDYQELKDLKKQDFGDIGISEKVKIIKLDVYEMSSTQIRNAVKNDMPIDDCVAKETSDYIKQHKLYKN